MANTVEPLHDFKGHMANIIAEVRHKATGKSKRKLKPLMSKLQPSKRTPPGELTTEMLHRPVHRGGSRGFGRTPLFWPPSVTLETI